MIKTEILLRGVVLKKVKVNREKTEKKESIFTRETLGVVLILFSALCLVCLIAGGSIFSTPGAWVSSFLLGCFGYFAYAVCVYGMVCGLYLVIGKKSKLAKRQKASIWFFIVLLALLLHIITMGDITGVTFGDYLADSYNRGAGGLASCSGGGVITGIIAFCISSLLTPVGGYIVLGILLAVSIATFVIGVMKNSSRKVKAEEHRSSFVKPDKEDVVEEYTVSGVKEYPIAGAVESASVGKQKLFISNPENFALKTKKDIKHNVGGDITIGEAGGLNVGIVSNVQSQTSKTAKQVETPTPAQSIMPNSYQEKLAYIRTPAEIKIEGLEEKANKDDQVVSVSNPIPEIKVETPSSEPQNNMVVDIPYFEHDESETDSSALSHAQDFGSKYADVEEFDLPVETSYRAESISRVSEDLEKETFSTAKVEEPESKDEEITARDILGMLKTGDTLIGEEPEVEEEPKIPTPIVRERRNRVVEPIVEEKVEPILEPEPEKEPEEEVFVFKPYVRPPLDLLATYEQPIDAPKEDHESKMGIIEDTLHQFKIEAQVVGYVQGPTLTRYELTMPSGKSVKEVGKYDDDLKMRLRSENGVRIEAPIPGLDRVGVEVENQVKCTVGLRKTMEGMAEKPMKAGELRFAIGQDLLGQAIFDNLAAGPHYLVAGSTGSGKSVCLHAMIISLIMTYGPEDLRIILVNPKIVEFGIYEGLPHLLVNEVLNNAAKTNAALSWAYDEMIRRQKLFMEHADIVVDIDGYNKYIAVDGVPKLPKIVIIVDEYADLVSDSTAQKEVSSKVAAIAQMSRSAGIHMVIATQRPTTNIVTGTIKTNLPSRIALKLTNTTDSMTILDEAGAEKLLGHGDMLYRNSNMSNCKRYQGAYLDRLEMKNVVSFIKANNETHFDEKLTQMVYLADKPKEDPIASSSTSTGGDDEPDRGLENDDVFIRCVAFGVRTGSMSISALQRHFPIGYNKAAKIFDKIEALGFISGNEGSKARKMLLTQEEFENRYGPLSDYGMQ